MKVKTTVFTTQACSPVIDLVNEGLDLQNLTMERRSADVNFTIPRPITNISLMNIGRMKASLESLISDMELRKEMLSKERVKIAKTKQKAFLRMPAWKAKGISSSDSRDLKAQRVFELCELGVTKVSQLMKETKLSRYFVKRAVSKWLLSNQVLKDGSRDIIEAKRLAVDQLIDQKKLRFSSLGEYKRRLNHQNIVASSKYISKRLKLKGRRFAKPIVNQKPKRRVATRENIEVLHSNLSIITQGLASTTSLVLTQDEIKFPISQVPTKIWRQSDSLTDTIRTGPEVTITCAVLASLDHFLTIQFYSKEMTARDFEYFMVRSLELLQLRVSKTIIILDRAPWHQGADVLRSQVSKLFLFNLPGWYELNPVESMFSKIRKLFRSRAVCESIKEELIQIVSIFQRSNTTTKLGSWKRGFTKSCLKVLEKYLLEAMEAQD